MGLLYIRDDIPWACRDVRIQRLFIMIFDQLAFAFAAAAPCVAAQTVINLSGNDWTVQNENLNISVPGSLPSQAHLDLYNAQVIGNP